MRPFKGISLIRLVFVSTMRDGSERAEVQTEKEGVSTVKNVVPSGGAVVKGVMVTVAALAVWELWGRDAVSKLKS